MATSTVRDREGNLSMADATFLPQQDRGHTDLIGTFLRDKNRRVTVGAIQPLGVLLMGVYHVRHRTLNLTDNVQIHHHRFDCRVIPVKSRTNQIIVERLHPINAVAIVALWHRSKCGQGWLQCVRTFVQRIVNAILCWWQVALVGRTH